MQTKPSHYVKKSDRPRAYVLGVYYRQSCVTLNCFVLRSSLLVKSGLGLRLQTTHQAVPDTLEHANLAVGPSLLVVNETQLDAVSSHVRDSGQDAGRLDVGRIGGEDLRAGSSDYRGG
jgi:hypothetical protein